MDKLLLKGFYTSVKTELLGNEQIDLRRESSVAIREIMFKSEVFSTADMNDQQRKGTVR